MRLLPGERVLFESECGRLKFTTHRIRYDRQGGGTGTIKSIMLEEIASCAMTRLTRPWLLILAALCVLAGLISSIQGGIGAFVAGFVFGLVFAIAYLLGREQVVAIASAGATIHLNTKNWDLVELRDLLDRIEAAKNARYIALHAPMAAVARH
jgi:hypothetical protein